MLDTYVYCDVERLSPEAPVPIARIAEKKNLLGGAANVAANLASLGVRTSLFGVVGDDDRADTVFSLCNQAGVEYRGVVVDETRPTTVKERIVSGRQQLLRIDHEKTHDIAGRHETLLAKKIFQEIPEGTHVVFSDYAKGLFAESFVSILLKRAKEVNLRVLTDPSVENFHRFSGVHLLKPNRRETEAVLGISFDDNFQNAPEIARRLKKFSSRAVVTLGEDGMLVCENGVAKYLHENVEEVYDVCGAGDTVIAVLAASLAVDASLYEAAVLANRAAGVVVKKAGTAVCSRDELLAANPA